MQKPMGENSSQWFETLLVLGFGPQNLELPFSTVKNIFVFFNMRAWLRLKDDSEQEGRWGLVIIFQFSLFMSFRLSFFHSPHYSIPSVRYFSCLALHAQCSTPIPFFQLFCFPREFHFFYEYATNVVLGWYLFSSFLMHMRCLLKCLVPIVSKDLILAFTCTRFSKNGFLISGAKI